VKALLVRSQPVRVADHRPRLFVLAVDES